MYRLEPNSSASARFLVPVKCIQYQTCSQTIINISYLDSYHMHIKGPPVLIQTISTCPQDPQTQNAAHNNKVQSVRALQGRLLAATSGPSFATSAGKHRIFKCWPG